MKILVINADCIFVNTSANLCHLAYLSGLSKAGHQVELLCADSYFRRIDKNMVLPKNVQCITYSGISLYERASVKAGHRQLSQIGVTSSDDSVKRKEKYARKLAQFAKERILSLYGVHGIYSTFVRKASAFRGNGEYDFVLSISTPTASHLLAQRLLKSGHVVAKHWIQIWEDPWYSDAYGYNGKEKIRLEEKRLLSYAEKVCYVSPLTLENQKRLFPESAHKMFWQPLPFYYQSDALSDLQQDGNQYGYFGDYVPAARDLEPFYIAAMKTGIEVNICGNPSNLFQSTERIHIHPRLPLDELNPIENGTNVLVFLCNRKGGQIPGKIYQYSATNKIILFIIDGTEEEQRVLKDFFGKFNRYVFCQNTVDDIVRAIRKIEADNLGDVQNVSIDEFNPVRIITNILEEGG